MPPVNTPMMQQYLRMKEQHPDCILMFRLGDFYEMFNEDARLASRELDLTLTSRDRGKPEDERTPMCGVPYHSADAYIARLIAKGYKVAICEQMEDPATAKGLVDRDIIRIITPGTVIAASMLEEGRNNFICAVYQDEAGVSLCLCDISTGEMSAAAFSIRASALARMAALRFSVSDASSIASCFAFSSDLARSSRTSAAAFCRAASMAAFPSSAAAASAAFAPARASAFICRAFSSASLMAVIASKDIDTPPAEKDGQTGLSQSPPVSLTLK